MSQLRIIGVQPTLFPSDSDSRLRMEITPSGSVLPIVSTLAEERARKDDQTRASLRPEIAALPIATQDVNLAYQLQRVLDAYNASTSVPAFSPLDLFSAALQARGLIEPVWGANAIIGYKPCAAALSAKPPVPSKKADSGAYRPGILLGLHNP